MFWGGGAEAGAEFIKVMTIDKTLMNSAPAVAAEHCSTALDCDWRGCATGGLGRHGDAKLSDVWWLSAPKPRLLLREDRRHLGHPVAPLEVPCVHIRPVGHRDHGAYGCRV